MPYGKRIIDLVGQRPAED